MSLSLKRRPLQKDTWCLAGLGNPGRQYADHRHNVGFHVVDALHQAFNLPTFQEKSDIHFSRGIIEGHRVLLAKPQTYMNRSGIPLSKLINFYKIPPQHLLVIHDELALPVGRVRVKKGGSAGSHNGLKSIDQFTGSDYWRLRIGIDHPGDSKNVSTYVLSPFKTLEQEAITALTSKIITYFPLLLDENPSLFTTRLAQHNQEKTISNKNLNDVF